MVNADDDALSWINSAKSINIRYENTTVATSSTGEKENRKRREATSGGIDEGIYKDYGKKTTVMVMMMVMAVRVHIIIMMMIMILMIITMILMVTMVVVVMLI